MPVTLKHSSIPADASREVGVENSKDFVDLLIG